MAAEVNDITVRRTNAVVAGVRFNLFVEKSSTPSVFDTVLAVTPSEKKRYEGAAYFGFLAATLRSNLQFR
jgi:hypothetical protein